MSSQRPGEKVVHQDYIARIRYSNALPPPPNPPKLLEIPGTGLSGGQYTSAGYASRLAREQPLNIEADAELGMPIDMIGIPGVFDGDERAIMARPGAQALHPSDKKLLTPLNSLGKPNAASQAVSFLRRTEYTSSQQTQHFTSSTSSNLVRLRNDAKRRKASLNKDDPINIMRHIVKGFDIAYPLDAYKGEDDTENLRGAQVSEAEIKAWSNPKHPTSSDLKLLDSYPVLPDLDATPPFGFYMVVKFQTNPVPTGHTYDGRLDTAFLRPVPDERGEVEFEEKKLAWEESDMTRPAPIRDYEYDYYLPSDTSAVPNLKRKLDVNDLENDDPALYTDDNEGNPGFKFDRLRRYETYNQHGDPQNLYNDSVAVALHDPGMAAGGAKERLQKGAYVYPVIQRTAIRAKRQTLYRPQYGDNQTIDELYVTVKPAGQTAGGDASSP